MLIQLKIENIALIEIIEINFEKGLNIITGDSGSGKSLILDSLNALFGGTNIPLKHLIRPGKDFCVIEAIFSSSFQINNWLISNGFEITSSELQIKRKSYKKNNKIFSKYSLNDLPINKQPLEKLGGFLLDAADSVTRLGTGTPYIPPNINSVPVVKRFLLDLDKGGGLQQQFYDLRNEVDRAVQTMNKLKKSGRFDELQAYRTNMQGVLNVKGQIRAIERYMDNWRKRRDVLLARTDINPLVKAELLEQLEMERDKRLSIITELKKKANVPAYQMGL